MLSHQKNDMMPPVQCEREAAIMSLTPYYISMIFINTMWGLSFIASKYALNMGFTPMQLALWRYIMAAAVLVPAVFIKEKRMRLHLHDIVPFILSSLFGITLYYLFEYKGIKLTSTVNASLILAAIPILTLVVDTVAMKTKLKPQQALGAVMSLLGVYMVVHYGRGQGNNSVTGDLLVVGASLMWVGYIFVSRKLRGRHTSLSMNAWQAVFSLPTLIPLALMERSDWKPIPISGWLAVAGLALICSALCYFLYGDALSHLSPVAVSIFINLIPLVTILGGVAFLKETVSFLQLAGGLLIVFSIFLVNLPQRRTVT
jgi:drug/metabolite transporter (DMT)-like permease